MIVSRGYLGVVLIAVVFSTILTLFIIGERPEELIEVIRNDAPGMNSGSDQKYGYAYTIVFRRDFDEVRIAVYMAAAPPTPVHIRIDNLFFERRASSLRNVMIDDGLELTVTSIDGQTTFVNGSDYDLNEVTPEDYKMSTHMYDPSWQFPYIYDEYVSSITWIDTTEVPNQVKVSYTAGVPADWCAGQQKTTYCLRCPGYLTRIKDAAGMGPA